MAGLNERVSAAGLGFQTATPFYGLPVDYGPAFADAATTFQSNAYSTCPVDTGFLQSTIGAAEDMDGYDCWTDAVYAEYVNSWSGFFTIAFEQSIAVAESHGEAAWVEALAEERNRILAEKMEALVAEQAVVDSAQAEVDAAQKEVDSLVAYIDQLIQLEDFYLSLGEFGWDMADAIAADIMVAEMDLAVAEDVLAQAQDTLTQAEIQYSIVEDYWNNILASYAGGW